MKKIKSFVSILLAFTMIFLMVISPSALVVKDYDNIYSAYGDYAVVIGKAPEYANQLVTMLLLKGDGLSAESEDVLYVREIWADEEGYYETKFKYTGFVVENGKVTNCTLRVKAGTNDVTDTVLSATVKKSDMMAVELETVLSEDSASVTANLNNLYRQSLDTTVMIAAYDEHNRLLGVKSADNIITDETGSISVTFSDLPVFDRLVAFVWDSTSSLIPYMEQTAIEIPNAVKNLVIHPGSDETMRRFTWYNTQETVGAQLQYALKADYIEDGGFTAENSVIVTGTTEIPYMNTADLSCKAEIYDLELGTEYVYRVGNAHLFDDNVYSFKTHKIEDKQVFAIVSDIHNTMKDYSSLTEKTPANRILRCTNIYNSLMQIKPETQFIVSAGDNISIGGSTGSNIPNSEMEYYRIKQELEMDQLFAPDIFRKVPFISVVGNHETVVIGNPKGGVTKYHYNLPNDDGVSGTYSNTNQHGNWWFRNGDVLIIGILLYHSTETGAYVNVTPEVNKAYIEKALEANKDAKWKIVVNHVPAYSSAIHTGEEGKVRDLFAELDLDNLDIDAVISGHQHAYSRSKQLLTNKYEDTDYMTYINSSNKNITLMKPKVVSEDDVVDGEDENGYQIDTATNPKGIVHIDVPSMMHNGHTCLVPDFKDFLETYGITSEAMVYPDGASVPADDLKEAIRYTPSSSLFVTIEKLEGGAEQIKFEFIKNNGSVSNASNKFEVLDTYIIKKTFE